MDSLTTMCFYQHSNYLALVLTVNHDKERQLGLVERVANKYGRPSINFRNASDDWGPDVVALAGKPLCSSLGSDDL